MEIVKSSPLHVLNLMHGHGQLEARELDRAETMWVQSIQLVLWEGVTVLRKLLPPYIDQFCLFLDEQHVLWFNGRICNSTLSDSATNSVLLPAKHWYVRLLVMDTHRRIKYGGINITLTTLREQCWVLKGRQVVKGIVRKCIFCKNYKTFSIVHNNPGPAWFSSVRGPLLYTWAWTLLVHCIVWNLEMTTLAASLYLSAYLRIHQGYPPGAYTRT